MLDAVNNLTLQSSTASSGTRGVAAVAAPEADQRKAGNFVTSSIRVDNLQNFAILEYRNQSGQVVKQYPTQAQIDAFKNAQRLLEKRIESHHHGGAEAARTERPAAPSKAADTPVLSAPQPATASTSPSGTENPAHSVLA